AARLLASRRVDGAAGVLLDYVPNISNEWTLEEVLASIGNLTVHPDAVDPLLKDALSDKRPQRRAAAVYILGRHGGLDQRETVRSFLADPDEQVRQWAVQSLVGKRPLVNYKDLVAADESLIKQKGLGTEESALLDILRKRTLQEDDQ